MKRATVVRDAIWGDINLGPRELAIIDTAAFQRLRRVKQLGFTDVVYPGAVHTRFEHSLGVFHLAGVALERVAAAEQAPALNETDKAGFLAAALLHDIGHYPFSHAVEELEVGQIRSHTDIARDLVCGGEIAGILQSEWGVDPQRVAVLVAGPGPHDRSTSEADALLRTVLDSGLDVDKLDYLVRDARGANVPYGVVDVQRLISSLTVWRDGQGLPRLAVEGKGVASLDSLVFAKHLMYSTVYWHHTCRSAVAMLLRAIQEALDAGCLESSDLESSDDAELMLRLMDSAMPDLTRGLATTLRRRRLYKRAVQWANSDPQFRVAEPLWFRPAERQTLEDSWATAAGSSPGSVLLDIPEPRLIAMDLPVVVGDDQVTDWDHIAALGTAELDRFQSRARLIRVFAADAELASRLGPIATF